MKNTRFFLIVIIVILFSACSQFTQIEGEVFVTDGDGKVTKLGGTTVKLITQERVKKIEEKVTGDPYISEGDYEVTTDSEGRFKFNAVKDSYYIICRKKLNAKTYFWKVIAKDKNVLSEKNTEMIAQPVR